MQVNRTLDSENVAAYPVHYQGEGHSIEERIEGLQIGLYKAVVYRLTQNLN
jgi:hypothetical protein